MRTAVAWWLSIIHPDRCDQPFDDHPDADAGSRWGTPRCDRRPHPYPKVRHRRRAFPGLHGTRVW